MREQTITEFLGQLADRVPAPGGGASAALHAAQAGALLGMVARYSTGAKYAAHRDAVDRIIVESDALRAAALDLAEADAAAFTAVTEAYTLPKGTDAEQEERSAAIGAALVRAAEPPAEVIDCASSAIEIAEELLPIGNRNVITDVAAAAEAARAAATTARVNVEVNLGGMSDAEAKAVFVAAAAQVDAIVERVEEVTAAVRAEISP